MSKPDISKPLFGWGTALKGQGDLTGMNEYKKSMMTQAELQSHLSYTTGNSSSDKSNIMDNFYISTGFAPTQVDVFNSASSNIAALHGVSLSSDPLSGGFGYVKTNGQTAGIEIDSSVYGAIDYGKPGRSMFEIFGDITGSFLSAASGKTNPVSYGVTPAALGTGYADKTTQESSWKAKDSTIHSFYDKGSASNGFYDDISSRWGSKGWGSSE